MKGIKEINIQIITEEDEFAMKFLDQKKIVAILGDKKTSISSFFNSLIKIE